MLRGKNGSFKFYQLEEYQSAWDRWVRSSPDNYVSYEDFEIKQLLAIGDVWQELEEFGCYSYDYITNVCNYLNQLAIEKGPLRDTAKVTKFRIIEVNITQEIKIMNPTKY